MKPTRSDRPTLRLMISSLAMSAMLFVQNAAAFTIATNPPFLPTPLPPNIVMTFDDSGSMRWAYAPDSMCSDYATRRVKSSDYNPLYYNPRVRYDPPVKYDAGTGTYSEYTTSFSNAYVNGFYQGWGTVNLGSDYRPTWSKNPAVANASDGVGWGKHLCSDNGEKVKNNYAPHPSADFASTNTGTQAYYYVYDTTLAGCTSVDTNDACYRKVTVSSTSGPGAVDLNGDAVVNDADKDERQNFAIWYSFYRTRNLMTATAATRALVGVPPTARVGWQSLNSCNSTTSWGTTTGRLFDSTCSGWSGTSLDKRVKVFDGQHRSNLLNWLGRLPADGSTPLREGASRVGEYFRTNGVNSPYAQTPTVSLGTEYSCRPNFHILMTDGIWNDNTGYFCNGSSCGNRDNSNRTMPDGKLYNPTRNPFKDNNSSSVADIAFHYWATDLRSDLANNLTPYRVDRTGTEEAQYWNPKNDPATWQHVVTFTVGLGLGRTFTAPGIPWGGSTYAGTGYANLANGAANWPATGADASPGNVYDLWHAALNSRGQSFSADNPRDLSDALATAVNRILERESAAAALATNSTRLSTDTQLFQARFFSGTWTGSLTAYAVNTDGSVGSVQWEATAPGKIPAHNARNIVTWGGSAGIAFEESALAAAGLWGPIGSAAMLNYLRGDSTNEVKNGGLYRSRSTPLADIINSDPAFVATENFGYKSLASEGASYPAFVAAKASRLKMLYVGSNDGFLRGFNATSGQEIFAYVPAAVIPDMPALTNPDYTHRFFVDGAPSAWDAYIGGGWKTVLTGTTGAGGKAVFALDVTNPAGFTASNVLWEINHNTPQRTGDAANPEYATRLGYTINQPVVAKLNNGEWAAIFGNGYRSTSEKASLYVVRISDGRLIKRIDTGVGALATPNGLGTPTLYDANGDDVYDAIYAPDMRGNVWKFDLSSSNPTSWAIALPADSGAGFPNGTPLFTASNASSQVQPISTRIELASPPAGKAGIMVLFGTGRLIAVNDNTDATVQTFYGIWDNNSTAVSSRSALREQEIDEVTIDLRGVSATVRRVSSEPVDWTSQRGWYIDLPTSLERVIGGAAVRDGRVIFTTVVPSNDPCVFGGSGWLMEVSATTGAKLPYAVFDTTGDKLVTSADQDISGVPVGVGMVKRALAMDGSPVAAKFLSGTTSEIQIERNRTFGRPLGRESWREVQR